MTPDEIRRFLAEEYGLHPKESEPPKEMRADARLTMSEAIAGVWIYALGKDPDILNPYKLVSVMRELCACARVPLSRCDRVYAEALKGAAEILLESDYLKREESADCGQQQSEGESKVLSAPQNSTRA